MVVNW